MSKNKVNIYAIAKEAKVSPATVSRVLTNSARVSSEKKKRVQDAIDKYGFKPNIIARRLSGTASKVIGIIVADISNPFYSSLFIECEKAAYEKGYTVLLCDTFGNADLEENHLQNLREQKVDAVILIGGRVDELVADENYVKYINDLVEDIPIITNGYLEGSNCYQVNINERQACELLMEYLMNLGHKDIALIGGRENVKSTHEKRECYIECLKKRGIDFNPNWIIEGKQYNIENGYNCMNKLFESDSKLPSAIVAINDFTAVGIMKSIIEHGLSIPEDISIASFDNTYVSEIIIPNLTTIGYNYKNFGETLIDVSIKAIEKRKLEKVKLIDSEILIRNSCKEYSKIK